MFICALMEDVTDRSRVGLRDWPMIGGAACWWFLTTLSVTHQSPFCGGFMIKEARFILCEGASLVNIQRVYYLIRLS